MNWKLICLLSLFGLVTGFSSVLWIPSGIESFIWLVVLIASSYLIAKKCTGKYFLHGLLTGIGIGFLITLSHILLYLTNLLGNSKIMTEIPLSGSQEYIIGYFAGVGTGRLIGTGLVLGLFAFIASKFQKKAPNIISQS